MIRRPPRSTLFPSPTLSRSPTTPRRAPRRRGGAFRAANRPRAWSSFHVAEAAPPGRRDLLRRTAPRSALCRPSAERCLRGRSRSEEHTSELQSLAYLVCRLLLETKKKRYTI